MSLVSKLSTNARDVRAFGLGVLARHLGRGSRPARLRGVGSVVVRRRNTDMECFRQVFRDGEYSLAVHPAVEARIRARYDALLQLGRTPVVIDGGANVGASAIWFAQRFPEAKVVAIEPDDGNFDLLTRNTAAHSNVAPMRAALGAEAGFVAVRNWGPGWAVRTERAVDGLPIVTVPQAVASVADGGLFLAKIDIEGFERDLFASNLDWIDDAYVVLIEPHDWMLPGQFTSRPFMRAMAAHEFELFILGENLAFVRA